MRVAVAKFERVKKIVSVQLDVFSRLFARRTARAVWMPDTPPSLSVESDASHARLYPQQSDPRLSMKLVSRNLFCSSRSYRPISS